MFAAHKPPWAPFSPNPQSHRILTGREAPSAATLEAPAVSLALPASPTYRPQLSPRPHLGRDAGLPCLLNGPRRFLTQGLGTLSALCPEGSPSDVHRALVSAQTHITSSERSFQSPPLSPLLPTPTRRPNGTVTARNCRENELTDVQCLTRGRSAMSVQ